jgi:hypothetical protein
MVVGFKVRRQSETMPLQPCGGNVTILLQSRRRVTIEEILNEIEDKNETTFSAFA